jgi:D-alanyl-lipoteichoic acid acyltransferase DltB (MBOAT superfamily)
MRLFGRRRRWLPWLAFAYPILLLVVFRYLPFAWSWLLNRSGFPIGLVAATIIGLSYMAFRLSHLVIEVRNGTVPVPTLSEYLGFAFFLPTMVVGPINPYHQHRSSLINLDRSLLPARSCLLRIVVGLTKYQFLGNLANQLTYGGIFLDGKPHGFFDLATAMVFYYLYLYCNFSGFCDMAIGVAGLIGIRVKENFDNPFRATNVKEFWNRWHITLSDYTREVIFAPLTKALIKELYTTPSITIGILTVFLTIGVWHGVGWRFAQFGLIHAVGVIINHYYTIWMKQKLGKAGYRAYNENLLINALATAITFVYVAMSFAVFANDNNMMRVIENGLRAGLYVR